MRLFAFYLPQFHEIPENNQWWGEGFTEWTNVRKAESLYRGHKQPKVPLNQNYYNLLDKSTLEWQLALQKKYGIDGLIFYHYYFKGKLLLEKPAENLLRWKDLHQSFFFCWGNHPWIRSWEGTRETIMPLEYGGETDWEEHFQYLLPFFQDERYEKMNNMPLFCVFQSDFPEKKEMFAYLNRRSMEEGFNGICFIESYPGYVPYLEFKSCMSEYTKKVLFREPLIQKNNYLKSHRAIHQRGIRRIQAILRDTGLSRKPLVFDGRKLMDALIQSDEDIEEMIPAIWFEWDNTPRHKQRGYVITPYTKDQFMTYMDKIAQKDYVFINAWNEWAEGMVLEPTEEKGYQYLEWISEWKKRNQQN